MYRIAGMPLPFNTSTPFSKDLWVLLHAYRSEQLGLVQICVGTGLTMAYEAVSACPHLYQMQCFHGCMTSCGMLSRWVSFMYSYPNIIPLPPGQVLHQSHLSLLLHLACDTSCRPLLHDHRSSHKSSCAS